MSKRRHTKMVVLLPEIEKILEAGMSHREIEDELELNYRPRPLNCSSLEKTKAP